LLDLLRVIVLGIIEGLTEFLPISSTGHLVLFERWMGIDLKGDLFWSTFTIFIQIGAIFAVVVYFREKILALLLPAKRRVVAQTPLEISTAAGLGAGQVNSSESVSASTATATLEYGQEEKPGDRRPGALIAIIIGTLPVLVIGYLAQKAVEAHLENPVVIAASLGIGGIIMILIEWLRPGVRTEKMDDISVRQSFIVGFSQVLAAVFPGTSRSAATIMPGMCAGLSRTAATEFSFFLAIPAMFAACGYSLLKLILKHREVLTLHNVLLLTVGTLVSFLVAWIVIAAFMAYIKRYSFTPFGIYRIVLSAIVFYFLLAR
jgi:undecaprenyl-diphosphatase